MTRPALATNVAAIVLAAGGSRRLGQPKQLVSLAGEPLVRRAARLALEAGCAPVVVVLGPELQACQAALAGLDVLIQENPRWQAGMSTSLHAGLTQLQQLQADAPVAALVLVVDQFQLELDSLERLLAAARAGRIAAARYRGRLGVPAVFPRDCWAELARLEGDAGARGLLEREAEQVLAVDMPEAVADLDTAEDLALLRELPARQ